jgi:hypothetical protein
LLAWILSAKIFGRNDSGLKAFQNPLAIQIPAFTIASHRSLPMCCVARTLTYISDVTGFDNQGYFQSPEQVRTYFRIEVMERLYPGWSKKTALNQADLDEMAGAVIHHKWHCVF